MSIKWTKRNSKLAKNPLKTIGFGLQAGTTCPMAGNCRKFCYATQGAYTFKGVKASRAHNYNETQSDEFVKNASIDLMAMKSVEAVRIHDSGDFYDQSYLDKWIEISSYLTHIKFYAYTKSLHLDFSAKPDNLVIIQSVGGKLDDLIDTSKPHAKVFKSHEDRIKAGYADGTKTDEEAYRGTIKIGLVYHGTKNITKEMGLVTA